MSHERLFRIKAELERQQAMPDQERAQRFNAQKGEPIGTQGLMVSKSYETAHYTFWHDRWPTKKILISKTSMVEGEVPGYHRYMNQLETKYIMARASMLDSLYATVNQVRKELGLSALELAQPKDYSRDVTPRTGMTVYEPQRGVIPGYLKPVVIEGITISEPGDDL